MKFFFVALVFSIFIELGYADSVSIVGVPIKLGDSIESVQESLKTTMEPEDFAVPYRPTTKMLHLKTKGIWVFFDSSNRTNNIRLDAPFTGNIGGVKIGDSVAHLEDKLGKPIKKLKMGILRLDKLDPYLYYIDDATTVRFDFDRDNLVETIFIIK